MIQIHNMFFSYKKHPLFQLLNLEMEKGKAYGLLGLNGAGKTTLLQLMTGLLFPEKGTVRVFNETPSLRHPSLLSRIFVVPEEIYLPSIKISDYVHAYSDFYPDFRRELLDQYLDRFQLPGDVFFNKISYGQKKKFIIAFALASGAELLIFDEPTNGLDIPSKVLFRQLVAETLDENRIVLFSTHQIRDIDALIDSIVLIHNGQTLIDKSIDQLSKFIHMRQDSSPPDEAERGFIFTQGILGNYFSLWQGASTNDTKLDLELLFNAAIARPEILTKIFTSQGGIQ